MRSAVGEGRSGGGRAAGASVVVRLSRLSKAFRIRRSWKDLARRASPVPPVVAVRGLDLEIREGEFFGLLGANGAGKTTIFKMLATLVVPDSGSATVAGFDLLEDSDRVRRLVAAVFANERSLHWRLSAVENLRLFASLHGLGGVVARNRVHDLLDIVGLRDTAGRLVGTFSSGMKQRLLIARALVASPRLLLLDEPTRSLDPIAARDFRAFLREEIGRVQGCTVVLATHDSEEVRDLCDRVAILDRGELRAVGTTEALVAKHLDHRYHLWTTEPAHPAFRRLEADGLLTSVRASQAAEGRWACVEVVVSGGPDDRADVAARLVAAGVPLARFERAPLSLAELIEAVVAQSGVGCE